MVILSSPLITLDLGNPKQVAKLLDEYATDFVEVVHFLSGVAKSQGHELDVEKIAKSLRNDFGYGE